MKRSLAGVLGRSLWMILLALGVFGALAGRVAWEGRQELDQAARARTASDVDAEIEHLGRAARWRLPLADHDEAAVRRLLEIAETAEAEQDGVSTTALAAYREIRRALLATRAWDVPRPDLLERVNRRIATAMGAQERAFETNVSGDRDPVAYHLELLQQDVARNRTVGNLSALAFVAWILGIAGFVLRGLDAQGRLRPRPALGWGGASLVFMVLWLVLWRFAE